MSFVPAAPIASGKPYQVVDVSGRTPDRLDNFVGERAFHIASGDSSYQVQGVGRLADNGVRFVEKDAGGSKDVRVWLIRERAGAAFTAEHSAVF